MNATMADWYYWLAQLFVGCACIGVAVLLARYISAGSRAHLVRVQWCQAGLVAALGVGELLETLDLGNVFWFSVAWEWVTAGLALTVLVLLIGLEPMRCGIREALSKVEGSHGRAEEEKA